MTERVATSPGSGMRVRAAGLVDAPLLAALEAASFPEPWEKHDLELLLGSGAIVAFVLEAGPADPIGHALFQLLPGETELLRIGVLPDRRRQGAARMLLERTLDTLAAEGRPVCHLEVRAGNDAARALYERLGFVATSRRRRYYGDGEDALRYRREHPRSGG